MKTSRITITLLLLQIVAVMGLRAQTPDLEVDGNLMGWYYQIGSFRLSDRFSLSDEIHVRRAGVFKTWQQFLFRPSINYHLNEQAKATVGYTLIRTYPYGQWPVNGVDPENNVCGQFQLNSSMGKLKITHPLRLEERWIGRFMGNEDQISGYAHAARFRYRITGKILLSKKSDHWAMKFFSETWLNLSAFHLPVGFNQQWLAAAIDYRPVPSTTLELGLLNQWLNRGNSRFENNLAIQLGCILNFDFRRKKE